MKYAVVAFLIALAVSYFLTPWVRRLAMKQGVMDLPDARRVHKEPIPRWGGLAIYIAVAAAVGLLYGFTELWDRDLQVTGLLVVGAFIVLMGALDDKYQFSAVTQLLFLLAAGVGVQLFGVQVQGITQPFGGDPSQGGVWFALGHLAMPLTALWIFIVTKTMDTIDGLDGLAAGVSAIAAAAIVFMSVVAKQPEVAVASAAACGAAVGFLKHNYNPAKIFMGTGGAQFLGFLLAGLSIIGTYKSVTFVVMAISLLVFGLPLFDAVQVVLKRLLSGQPLHKADKRHVHHALLAKGLSQRQAVLVLYAVAGVLSATAVLVFNLSRR